VEGDWLAFDRMPTDRPRYIAFEGIEGCGKSTQATRLATALGAVLTRETGGTAIGARVREVLHDPANTNLSPVAEALLIAGDRAQHRAEVLAPALAAGKHVVSDRSVYSRLTIKKSVSKLKNFIQNKLNVILNN